MKLTTTTWPWCNLSLRLSSFLTCDLRTGPIPGHWRSQPTWRDPTWHPCPYGDNDSGAGLTPRPASPCRPLSTSAHGVCSQRERHVCAGGCTCVSVPCFRGSSPQSPALVGVVVTWLTHLARFQMDTFIINKISLRLIFKNLIKNRKMCTCYPQANGHVQLSWALRMAVFSSSGAWTRGWALPGDLEAVPGSRRALDLL